MLKRDAACALSSASTTKSRNPPADRSSPGAKTLSPVATEFETEGVSKASASTPSAVTLEPDVPDGVHAPLSVKASIRTGAPPPPVYGVPSGLNSAIGGLLSASVIGRAPLSTTVNAGALPPSATCVRGTPPLSTTTTGGWLMTWLPVLAWLLRPWLSPPHQ